MKIAHIFEYCVSTLMGIGEPLINTLTLITEINRTHQFTSDKFTPHQVGSNACHKAK